jgi:hypothetical protein
VLLDHLAASARLGGPYLAALNWPRSAPHRQGTERRGDRRRLPGREGSDANRRRLLVPYQHHSPAFKKADLKVVAVEDSMFNHVEEEILKAAFDAVRDPSTVPLGILREEVTTNNGHTYTKFHGRPLSWMAPFMQPGKRVKRIIERNDSYNGGSRVIYEPQA